MRNVFQSTSATKSVHPPFRSFRANANFVESFNRAKPPGVQSVYGTVPSLEPLAELPQSGLVELLGQTRWLILQRPRTLRRMILKATDDTPYVFSGVLLHLRRIEQQFAVVKWCLLGPPGRIFWAQRSQHSNAVGRRCRIRLVVEVKLPVPRTPLDVVPDHEHASHQEADLLHSSEVLLDFCLRVTRVEKNLGTNADTGTNVIERVYSVRCRWRVNCDHRFGWQEQGKQKAEPLKTLPTVTQLRYRCEFPLSRTAEVFQQVPLECLHGSLPPKFR